MTRKYLLQVTVFLYPNNMILFAFTCMFSAYDNYQSNFSWDFLYNYINPNERVSINNWL